MRYGKKLRYDGKLIDPKTGKLNKFCIDCGTKIGRLGTPRCKPCYGKYLSILQRGIKNPSYKDGTTYDCYGYRLALAPENHPYRMSTGYIFEHRLIMENRLGRYLREEEVVHHVNGKKDDNRPENLQLFESSGEHTTFHHTKRGFTCALEK